MSDRTLTSHHNPKYRRWLSLLESKGIKEEGQALLSGEKLVRELLETAPRHVREFVLPPKGDWPFAIPTPYRVTAAMFKALDTLGTGFPLAVVDAPAPEFHELLPEPEGLELIVALQDPANLGALLRSAEAFGVKRVWLTREAASPYLPKALKAASLSTFRLELVATGALKDLRVSGGLGLDMRGEDVDRFAWPKNAHLILGEEGRGLPATLALKRLRIPMAGEVESLNATVAASVALFVAASRRRG